MSEIVLFLNGLLDKVKSHSTINTYRSTLSLIMVKELTDNRNIRRLFKPIAVLKPPKPKYSYTWDPAPVLNHLSTFFANENISLQSLTVKLATLLALIAAQGVQTIANIELENINTLTRQIIATIPDHIKASVGNRNQPLLTIPFFSGSA